MINSEFIEWLINERNKRNWKQSDLARHSGLSTATIYRIEIGTRGVGDNSLNGIARAFNLPVDYVYQKAGILKEKDKTDHRLKEFIHLFKQVPLTYQNTIIELMRVVAENKEKYQT